MGTSLAASVHCLALAKCKVTGHSCMCPPRCWQLYGWAWLHTSMSPSSPPRCLCPSKRPRAAASLFCRRALHSKHSMHANSADYVAQGVVHDSHPASCTSTADRSWQDAACLLLLVVNCCPYCILPEQVAGLADGATRIDQHAEQQRHLIRQAELLLRVRYCGQHGVPDAGREVQDLQHSLGALQNAFQGSLCAASYAANSTDMQATQRQLWLKQRNVRGNGLVLLAASRHCRAQHGPG